MDIFDSDPACVKFKTCEDGRSIQVNRYFLFLYDAFYKSILEENMENSLVFIFVEATFDELNLLKKQIYQKHFQCVDHSESQKDDQENKSNEDNEDTSDIIKAIEPDEEATQQNTNTNITEDETSLDSLLVECPFNCDELPESEWTADSLFAHIFSKHRSDVKNNFFVSIDTFIERLGSELSSQKCAFKCEKSRNYADLRALRDHYHRCHTDEPVICSNCGDSFKNSKTYYGHTRACHVEKKTCDICNNGKIYKKIYHHMYQHHNREKNVNCEVEGCSIRFKGQHELEIHTRIVHKKEKPFVCEKCGIKMSKFQNLKIHRMKVHSEKFINFNDYKEMIKSGQHNFVPKGSIIPKIM